MDPALRLVSWLDSGSGMVVSVHAEPAMALKVGLMLAAGGCMGCVIHGRDGLAAIREDGSRVDVFWHDLRCWVTYRQPENVPSLG